MAPRTGKVLMPYILPISSLLLRIGSFLKWRLMETGRNLKVIQQIMGHADAETTMDIYAEATKDLKKSEIINFEDYFNRQKKKQEDIG